MAKPASSTARGYGYLHRKERARLKPTVDAGLAHCTEIICLLRSRHIIPGTPWDLAHDRTRPGQYLGPAHSRCNRAEGVRHRTRLARARILKRTSRIW